jgi:cyclohexanone monooxygenase
MTSEASGTADIEIDVEALNKRYAEERARRLRSEANAQYVRLEGKFADFDKDIYADPNFTRAAVDEQLDVLIIGGGFAGLLTAIRLRERGIENFRIIERGADVGGTWYWNRYPGAASDVEGYIYLPMLEELGYVPAQKYSPAPEIHAHCQKLAKHFDLYPKALFQTRVTGDAQWDEASSRWLVTTHRGDKFAARFLISCTGTYDSPKLPNIAGAETFEGHAFHTSRWDYDYTGGNSLGGLDKLGDKVVGVIGTGATAVQCIPHLAASAKHLYVFQRTPSSVDVRNQKSTDLEWAKSLKPGWQWERTRNFTSLTSGEPVTEDLIDDGWTDIARNIGAAVGGDGDQVQDFALSGLKKMEMARRRIDSIVQDKETAEALKPYYAYFCKRPCFHDDYLPVFNQPNVTLVDTRGIGVEQITPKGVVAAGKEYPVDCLVYATGFEFMTEFVKQTGYDLVGRGGRKLSEHWNQGARTLWGIQTSGFPNFFLMALNQAGVSVNYVHMATEQTAHFAFVIDECLNKGIASIEVGKEAEDDWVEKVLAAAEEGGRNAFLDSCTPSHYNHEGKKAESARLNDLYAGGPGVYVKLLEAWRAAGTMPGFHVTPA